MVAQVALVAKKHESSVSVDATDLAQVEGHVSVVV
jgi:hypothetical protein